MVNPDKPTSWLYPADTARVPHNIVFYCCRYEIVFWYHLIFNIHPGTPVFFLKNTFLMNLKGVWQIYSRGHTHIISLLLSHSTRPFLRSRRRRRRPASCSGTPLRTCFTNVMRETKFTSVFCPSPRVRGETKCPAIHTHTLEKCMWINGTHIYYITLYIYTL